MAIEDAVVLGKCLRDIGDVGRRTGRIRGAAAGTGRAGGRRRSPRHSMKVAGPVGRVVRDLTMPIVLKQVARHVRQEWMYGYHIDWDEPIRAAA